MTIDPIDGTIRWRLHLVSPPDRVYELLATAEGRARFWAESAREHDGTIDWVFPNGVAGPMKIVGREPPRRFAVEYFDDSILELELTSSETGGTDLTLTHRGCPAHDRIDTNAGWVSVLLSLKAAADGSVDLRNHDAARTWEKGFVDN